MMAKTFSQDGRIYLDYAAMAPMMPCVQEHLCAMMRDSRWANPASVHHEGRYARRLLEETQETLFTFLGLDRSYQMIWTSGGTEANQTLIHGLRSHVSQIWVSSVEHPSVRTLGAENPFIPVQHNGQVDLEMLEERLRQAPKPVLVSVQWVNSETGIVQPLEAIADLVHHYEGIFHTDGIQGLGKVPLPALQAVDALTFSGAKIGGGTGIGALILRENLPLAPLLKGGEQLYRLRAGTPHLLGVAGFQAALGALHDLPLTQWEEWRQRFESEIMQAVPRAVFHRHPDAQAPSIISLSMPGVNRQRQLIHFDLLGFAISSGSACTSGKVGSSSVLQAMHVPPEVADHTVRISWGWKTTWHDLEHFQKAWIGLARDRC